MAIRAYPAHISPNYHVWDKSPCIVIILHGQNPHGYKFGEANFLPMTTFLNALRISNLIYYRNYAYIYEDLIPDDDLTETVRGRQCQKTEIYNMKREFESLTKELQKLEQEHNLKNQRYIIIGHSLGGLYAAVFGVMFGSKCIKTISLDGFNFYDVLPFFMEMRANIEVDPSQLQYTESGIIYKGKPFDLARIHVSKELYKMAYTYRDTMINKHYIIYYFENSESPETAKLTKLPADRHYKHKHEIRYTKRYHHTLHMFEPVSKIIVDKFILNTRW